MDRSVLSTALWCYPVPADRGLGSGSLLVSRMTACTDFPSAVLVAAREVSVR